jgi:hypothetical protein
VFSDTPVANFVISSNSSNFSTLNGVLYNKDKTELVRVPEKTQPSKVGGKIRRFQPQ